MLDCNTTSINCRVCNNGHFNSIPPLKFRHICTQVRPSGEFLQIVWPSRGLKFTSPGVQKGTTGCDFQKSIILTLPWERQIFARNMMVSSLNLTVLCFFAGQESNPRQSECLSSLWKTPSAPNAANLCMPPRSGWQEDSSGTRCVSNAVGTVL